MLKILEILAMLKKKQTKKPNTDVIKLKQRKNLKNIIKCFMKCGRLLIRGNATKGFWGELNLK